MHISLQLEAWARDSKRNRGDVANKTKVRNAIFLSDDVDISLTRIENDLQKCVESLANVAQLSSQVTRQASQSSDMCNVDRVACSINKSRAVCWACGEAGHVQRNCTNPRPQPNATQPNVHTHTHTHAHTHKFIVYGSPEAVLNQRKPLDDPAYLEMTLASKKVL